MKRIGYASRIISLWFVFIFFQTANSQHLPQGEYHRNRERAIDIVHYKAELAFDFTKSEVSGKASVIFKPLRKMQQFFLDAIRLNIQDVHLMRKSEAERLTYESKDQSILIQLDRMYSPQETLTVTIRYSARPNAGMYFQEDNDHDGQFYVYTYGEGGLHANWLPIYNEVNDKFSSEMIVTVPSPYTVISNGALLGIEKLQKDEQTFHWKQDLPHSNYLISLYVGEFEKGEMEPAFGTIPIAYWVPERRLEEGAFVFRNTTKMVEFFSDKFDYRYPWDKYDQIAVPDYFVGAMEHTGVTGHRACMLRNEDAPLDFGPPDFDRYYTMWTAEAIISHELAHHWFGDNLTCRNLNVLWLNESFATYCNMLWDEAFFGQEMFHLDRREAMDRYFDYVEHNHIIRPLEYAYYDAVADIYTQEITYFKGALILHMLRDILGDDAFFHSWSTFLHKHEFTNVESQDFKIAIEEATGRNMDWFFDDWVYGGGYPIFEVSTDYLPGSERIALTVKQIQPIVEGQDLFKLPVEITVATSDGINKKTVWVEHAEDTFFLECDGPPLMVSFDGKGALVAEVRFDKSLDELLCQVKNDALPGRIWAMRKMAEEYPVHPKTLDAFSELLSASSFWWPRAEASRLLGLIRTPEAEKVISQALKSPDYTVRKAAVLALPEFRPGFAEKTLIDVIEKDEHSDVVATAIVALAKTNPRDHVDLIRKQIGRPSWYEEITMACLNALGIMGDAGLLDDIKPFASEGYHAFLRTGALQAWAACKPDDEILHRILIKNAEGAQADVQFASIEMLGRLYVTDAVPVLEKIVRESGDVDFRVAAGQALDRISRLKDSSMFHIK